MCVQLRQTHTAAETDSKTSAAVQMLLSMYSTHRVHRAKLITLHSHSLTLAGSSTHSEKGPWGKITTRIQT